LAGRSYDRTLPALCVSASLVLLAQTAHAQQPDEREVAATFWYATPAEKNYVRGLLELSGVVTFGFLWYATQTGISRHNYDVAYSWPVFRKKLSGEMLELDTNELGTNYVGHGLGGTMYYSVMRSNQLGILESFGVAIGGSLLWEYFGEIHEIVSINDMIVTPLSGIGIGEPLLQLGAFFDRGSPRLHNRILGTLFGPFKTLNDLLDGRTLARSQPSDANGFPANEWHQFDLGVAAATTQQEAAAPGLRDNVSQEWRFSLRSRLARLPNYADAGRHSMPFDDGNVSSIDVQAATTAAGLVDLNIATQFVALGYHVRRAGLHQDGTLWGSGTQLGLTIGYQYTMHDSDRDGARARDRIAAVQPLGVVIEHRAELGHVQLLFRFDAASEFAGVRPYALRQYELQPNAVELPTLLREHLYYFGLGAHAMGSLAIVLDAFEAQTRVKTEAYSDIGGGGISASDRRTVLDARASCGLPHTPLRLSAFVGRRWRSGQFQQATAVRRETSVGIELGARF
jgi:hypothetical protein